MRADPLTRARGVLPRLLVLILRGWDAGDRPPSGVKINFLLHLDRIEIDDTRDNRLGAAGQFRTGSDGLEFGLPAALGQKDAAAAGALSRHGPNNLAAQANASAKAWWL